HLPCAGRNDRETTAWIRAANTKPLGEFYEQIIRAIYTAILQPGDLAIDCGDQCSRFPGPLARQTRGADRYQHPGQPERLVEALIRPFSLAFGRPPSVGCS